MPMLIVVQIWRDKLFIPEQISEQATKFKPVFFLRLITFGAAIAQSVQRLATGWTDRGSNPGVERDFPHQSRLALGPTQPPIQRVPGLSRGVKRPARGVVLLPHLAPRLKKE